METGREMGKLYEGGRGQEKKERVTPARARERWQGWDSGIPSGVDLLPRHISLFRPSVDRQRSRHPPRVGLPSTRLFGWTQCSAVQSTVEYSKVQYSTESHGLECRSKCAHGAEISRRMERCSGTHVHGTYAVRIARKPGLVQEHVLYIVYLYVLVYLYVYL